MEAMLRIQRSERRLQESEERLRTILNSVQSGILIVDAETHRIADLNPAACRMIGAAEEEIVGQVCHRFVCPAEEGNCPVLDLGQEVDNSERVLLAADGREVPILKTVLSIELNGPPHLVESLVDISELKDVQEKVRASEERFRSLFAESPIAIEVYDARGRLVDANPACLALFGVSGIDQVRDFELFSDPNLPDEHKERLRRGETAQYEAAFDFDKVRELGLYETSRTGRIDLDVLITPLAEGRGNAVSQYLVQVQDITERKRMDRELRQREETLRKITTSAQDAVIMMDTRGGVSFWNESARKMFGYSEVEILGRPLHDMLAPARFRAAHLKAFPRFRETGEGAAIDQTLELIGLRKDGEEFPLELSLAGVELEDGWHAVGIARDITARQQTEEALRAAKQEAEAANQAKSLFLATMSHEIRTPMNAVIGFSDLLMATELTPVQRDYVSTVQVSSQALLGLINDILDFSKIEAGKLEMERREFGLRGLLEETADLFREKVAETGVELIARAGDEVPDNLVGDPLRLRQVLVNLAGNALKFTEAGEVEIRVEAAEVSSWQATLRFSVRDTGIGIAPEQIDRLFSAFTQADGSTVPATVT